VPVEVVETLKRGRLAATEIVVWRGRRAVRKTLSLHRGVPLLGRQVEVWLAAREARQLARADGIDGVPRLLARPAPNVFVREYVPGVPLPFAPAPPAGFFDRLRQIVLALHARGITHNDLHKEANVLVRPDGTPGLLDFQLSLSRPPGSELHRLLARFDLYHVAKNRRFRTGEELTGEEADLFRRTRELRRIHRTLVKRPMNLLTRRLFPGRLGKLPTDTDP
jgi:RIO-like serine/threonine protein kinase